jgi:hypothetical protein
MSAVALKDLRSAAAGLVPDNHPFFEMTLDDEFEDAVLGGSHARSVLWRRRRNRVLDRADVERARDRAEEIGRVGEEFVGAYLEALRSTGSIVAFSWVSDRNALAPYDFTITTSEGQEVALDVKSTNGPFERPMHISVAELTEMTLVARYDLYRIFEASETEGKLRIMEDVAGFASDVLARFRDLPVGIQVDSVSVLPELLAFGPAITVRLATEPE